MTMTLRPDKILKQGYMIKRSQNKKKLTIVNYKRRYLILTTSCLMYCESKDPKSKEKGRVVLSKVHTIETAAHYFLSADLGTSDELWPFLIGYTSDDDYTLFLLASTADEREQWISELREACKSNSSLKPRYHPVPWNGKKWLCCNVADRKHEGCLSSFFGKKNIIGSSSFASLTTLPLQSGKYFPDQFIDESDSIFNGNSSVSTTSTKMPGGRPPGTPTPKQQKPKVVVAVYNYQAVESGDLTLTKNQGYEVIDDSQEHWWKVKDSKGNVGFIPSNYVKAKEDIHLQPYDWYVADMSRQRSESILKHEDKEGCFVVRNSSTKGLYTLSLYTKVPQPHVKHYHIKQNSKNEYFLSEKHCCATIPDLINYHKHNSGGLASRLKCCPHDRAVPATAGLSHDKWEIDPHDLQLHEELGSGQFGVVRRGKWRSSIEVAVKMMKEGTMSEDDFIEEAKVMTKLQHPNLVQLYGVCSQRPIYIVTEFMKYGSLLNHLRKHEDGLAPKQGLLLDMCIQVCKGMAYLERHNYIHRDLAARNCLVGTENVIKVADFGLARYVLDDQYVSSGGSKFPIKWAPPEVLNYTRFSSKSDIWAYGVLMWEVFTCGKMPYGRMKNADVVDRVQKGQILEKPKICCKEVYDVMKRCWSHQPEQRPSFRSLKETLVTVSNGLLID